MAKPSEPKEATPRFQVLYGPDAYKSGRLGPEYEDCERYILVENQDNGTLRVLGKDGGEPEDQVLSRDWRWVPKELNALAKTNDALRAVADAARTLDAGYAMREKHGRWPITILTDHKRLRLALAELDKVKGDNR